MSSDEDANEEEDQDDDEEEEERPWCHTGKKGKKIKSGILDKASSANLIKKVWHAQAWLDADETRDDACFHELPFHLLVAGEMEILIN